MEVNARDHHGAKRILIKLESSIRNENYYEAHQMYRTLYFRYLGQRKYVDLIHLLYNGSLLLLERQQYMSGADLGILLIDVLIKSKTEPSQLYYDKLINLFSLMNPVSPERETFVQSALHWSLAGSTFKTGDPKLHKKLAEVYWHEKNYSSAQQHFLHTTDGFGCATMLVELHENQGYSNEVDLFITKTILQYLCLQNKIAADATFKSYVNQHPRIAEGPPFILPLLNFSFLLLKIIESGKVCLFTMLCEQYFTSLTKDPSFLQYLDKIGQLFFNVQPQNHSKGLLSSLLQSFFNGLEDTEDQQKSTPNLTLELD